MSRVEFLTRSGCSLCDAGRATVGRMASLLGVEVVDVDVDGDAELRDQYGGRVPVVRDGAGRVLAEGRLRSGAVAASLLRVRLAGDGGADRRH